MLIDADKIIVRDRIRKDFGNLQELADDIKENGLINPPVVTPDNVLIAGERRFRAMTQLLGWKQIEVRPMTVQDALHQLKLEISENENRKEFSFSEKMEWADRLKVEYGKIAEANSLAGTTAQSCALGRVDEKVSSEVGFGGATTYRHAQYVWNSADEEMIRQLDEKELSINAAYVKLKKQADDAEAKLKEVEQEKEEIKAEMVDQQRAINSNKDAQSFTEMANDKKKAEEAATKALNTLEVERREEREARKQAAAERKTELEQIKADKEKQAELFRTQQQKAIDTIEKLTKDVEAAKKGKIVRVAPDDYDEAKEKADLYDEMQRQPDKIARVFTTDQTPTEAAIDYFHFMQNSTGGFLSDMEGFALQKEFCTDLPADKKAFIAENLRTIMNRCAEIIDFIRDCREAA